MAFGFPKALLAEHGGAADADADAAATPVAATPGTRLAIAAPAEGRIVSLDDVPDAAFRERTLGDGFAVDPTSGRFASPVAGTITAIFPTGHAFGVTTPEGLEVLVHVGLGTVALDGEGFTVLRAEGDVVAAGDAIVDVDLDAVRDRVPSLVSPVVVLNGAAWSIVERDGDAPVVVAATATADA